MIEKLTPEQEAVLIPWRDKFLAIGLKTGPIAREKAKEIVVQIYKDGGIEPPGSILFFDSPFAAMKKAAELENKETPVWATLYGSHDAGWLSFYSFATEVLKIETASFKGLLAQLELGWSWLYPDVALVSERPSTLRRDELNRLHSAAGPALAYPDGFCIYSWHGIRVDKQIIDAPETLTVEQIQKESNVEVRRVMIERYGQAKYLRDSNAIVVNMDEIGILYDLPLPNDESLRMVRVLNSTPEPDGTQKEYMLRVPPTMQTPKEAIAWSFRLKAEEYDPAIET